MSTLGTELKINVHVEPIDGYHMSDFDFECQFYVFANKHVVIPKADMKQVDEDNYYALITFDLAQKIGRGIIKMRITAYIPDADSPDGQRTEIAEVCTGVVIM